MTNKEKYIEFCKTTYVPVFSQAWWLDAVCVNGYWDVILYEKKGVILGALPYYVKNKFGLAYIAEPEFTQMAGVIFADSTNLSYTKRLNLEKEISLEIINKLEKLPVLYFQQNFNYKFLNWIAFYWRNFTQTTKYRYACKEILCIDENVLLTRYSKDKRINVRKSMELGQYVGERISAKEAYDFHVQCLKNIGQNISYGYDVFSNIVNAVLEHNAGELLTLYNKDNELLAVRFFVWDRKAAYGINTAINHKEPLAGARIFHETTMYVSKFLNVFYLGGSMIKSVEESYCRFGTEQVTYFFINKTFTRNPFFKFLINKKLKKI